MNKLLPAALGALATIIYLLACVRSLIEGGSTVVEMMANACFLMLMAIYLGGCDE